MGERNYASITIGGDLPRSKLDEFMGKLKDSGAGPDSSGGIDFLYEGKHEKWSDEQRIELLLQTNGYPWLCLSDCEAQGSMFDELETWLRRNDIPFDRHSDAYYEWGASNLYFRPAVVDHEMTSDYNQNDVVRADAVRAARSALDVGDVHSALKALDEALGDGWKIPELPPFKLVDG